MFFLGHVDRSLDDKGRLMLPPEYRDYFTSQDAEGCLVFTFHRGTIIGITPKQWEDWLEKLLVPGNHSDALRQKINTYLATYEKIKIDKQGRVQIPPRLKKSGNLEGKSKVVVAGQGKHFAIMSEETFDAQLAVPDQDVSHEMDEKGMIPDF